MNRDSNLQSSSNSRAGDSALGHSHAPSFAGEAASLAAGGGALADGAEPNITAPVNCICPLRLGVDSICPPYPGCADRQVAVMLQEPALSADDYLRADEVPDNGGDVFTALQRGRERATFVRVTHVRGMTEYWTVVGELTRAAPVVSKGEGSGCGSAAGQAPLDRARRFLKFVARWVWPLILALMP